MLYELDFSADAIEVEPGDMLAIALAADVPHVGGESFNWRGDSVYRLRHENPHNFEKISTKTVYYEKS